MLNAKTVGEKIADARKKLALSQAKLAEQLFISPQAVGKWERGESLPDITTVNSLAEILGVDLNYFSETFGSALSEIAPTRTITEQTTDTQPAKPKSKRSWDMSRTNWVDADFSGLKNLHEKFSGSSMRNCKFIGSEMAGLLLKGNSVEGCDFTRSDISGSHVQGSHLMNNIFKDCSLRDAEFCGSHIMGCDFSGADFTGATVKSCAIQSATMTGAVLRRTVFAATPFADTVFEGTLEDCSFEDCTFDKVTFQNAKLISTFFKGRDRGLKKLRFVDCEADRLTVEFLKAGKADVSGITVVTP